MAAPPALTMVMVLALAACSNPASLAPSPSSPQAEPTPTPVLTRSSTPAQSPVTSPFVGVDPAVVLRIAPPYELVEPSASDFEHLSGNIRGLPSDLAESAGAGSAASDFPLGFRFVRDATRDVGVIVLLAMPPGVAELPGLLESIAAPVAAESNARLSFETIRGVQVGILKGPIASAITVLHGHLVMAQSGQPAVAPKDLIEAVVAANEDGFAEPSFPPG